MFEAAVFGADARTLALKFDWRLGVVPHRTLLELALELALLELLPLLS